jgi:molybdopterin molybdotransferase
MSGLLPVAEAQARLLALATAGPVARVPLAQAAGRWLAEDLVARVDNPFADLSAMDGYAIRFAELPGPWRVVGEVAAGRPRELVLAPGEAARIFTGAAVPDGADTILVQEDAARDGDRLALSGEGPGEAGAHIRRRGFNFVAGDRLIPAGARLTPARIGLAAMAGHDRLAVRARTRVALISTGDELAAPGAELRTGQIYASNAPLLAALLADLPVDLVDHGIVPDRLDALTDAVARAAADADILVTSGGASVGDHDLVRPALGAAGATLDFWRIAMRPGKPLMAGRLGSTVALGLPGNPVSAFVTAFLFLRPLVASIGGATDPLPATVDLPLAAPLGPNGPRADYVRASVGREGVRPLASQDSAALPALAAADALIARPPHAPAAPAGTVVAVHMLA